MSNLAFYREQAALRQADADAATLDNVRERNQRAADAWMVLADRLVHSDALRAERIGAGAIAEMTAAVPAS